MRVTSLLALGVMALGPALSPASAQDHDANYRWYLGAQAGGLGFGTRLQTRSWAPTVGGSLLVVAKRTGLLISVDEALGSNELTGYTDLTAVNSVRAVNFDHVRRYSAMMVGYPVKGRTRPYFGLGYNLIQVLSPEVGGVFTSATQAALAERLASNKSSTGHFAFAAGVEFRVGRALGFGQYQIATAPSQNLLLRGTLHGATGGFRFLIGRAREGVRGGGY
jgi:hypothetical protein